MQQEHRLALVLNGGISLAVWMGGAVAELNNLRCAALPADGTAIGTTSGSDDDQAPSGAPVGSVTVQDVWKEILTRVGNPRIAIDIIGGTSAGGLNGTILAQSIALGLELPSLKATWVKMGSLTVDTLLNKSPESTPWLLDAGFFRDQVTDILAGDIDTRSRQVSAPTGGHPVTLFTTATSVRTPQPTGSADSPAPDSRRVFAFRHDPRDPDRSPFRDGRTLALAARASASYPVAFEPAIETGSLASQRHPRATGRHPGGELMDGGVLDNAPFEAVIDEIERTPVRGPWKRHLLYISPSVDTPAAVATADITWITELAKVVTAIQEPDRRLDEEFLRRARKSAQNVDVRPDAVLLGWLRQGSTPSTVTIPAPSITTSMFELYRHTTHLAIEQVIGNGETFTAIKAGVLPSLMEESEAEPPAGPDLVGPPDGPWTWGIAVADRLATWWGRALNTESSSPRGDEEVLQRAFDAVEALQRHVEAVFMRLAVGEKPDETRDIRLCAYYGEPQNLRETNRHIHAAATMIGAYFRDRAPRPATTGGIDVTTGGVVDHSLSDEVVDLGLRMEVLAATMTWGHDMKEWPRMDIRRITPAEVPLLDEETFGRVTWPRKKLYGERWGHFGAFATNEARENDWLWGRLDAASALLDLLFDGHDRSMEPGLRRDLAAAILREEYPGLPFPQARDALVARTKAAMGTGGTDLVAAMEAEVPGTYVNLKHALFGLTQAASLAPGALLLLRTVLGVKGDRIEGVSLLQRLGIGLLKLKSQKLIDDRIRAQLGLERRGGLIRRGWNTIRRAVGRGTE